MDDFDVPCHYYSLPLNLGKTGRLWRFFYKDSLNSLFQENDCWGSLGGPLIFYPQLQMVHILRVSSRSRVIEEFDFNSKRTLKKTMAAIPGLSFKQKSKNDLKVIPTLLSKGRLSKISKKKNLSSGTTLSTIPPPNTLQTLTPD